MHPYFIKINPLQVSAYFIVFMKENSKNVFRLFVHIHFNMEFLLFGLNSLNDIHVIVIFQGMYNQWYCQF